MKFGVKMEFLDDWWKVFGRRVRKPVKEKKNLVFRKSTQTRRVGCVRGASCIEMGSSRREQGGRGAKWCFVRQFATRTECATRTVLRFCGKM